MRIDSPTLNVAVLLRFEFGWDRDVAQGVARYAQTRPHWQLFVWPSSKRLPRIPAGWKCDGIIAHPSQIDKSIVGRAPLVTVGGVDSEHPRAQPDNHAIARLAGEHLHEIGIRRATCIGGSVGWAAAREAGFRQVCEELEIEYLPCPVEYSFRADIDWSSAAEAMARWLRRAPMPLGVMGVNDGAARIASQGCQLANLHVPEQVAIIGADNDLMRCELSGRPLSSVDPAADLVGFAAAEILDRWITTGQKPSNEPVLISPRGVVRRRSTDVLAIQDVDIALALRYVREHALRPISVEDVAGEVSLSRRVLEKRFRRHVGRSVRQEIIRLRVRRACELLRATLDRLDYVAAASGFESLTHFHGIFRRHVGRTPASYRKSVRSGGGEVTVRSGPSAPARPTATR